MQKLVKTALRVIDAWERWQQIVPTGPAKMLHAALIRFSKGMVKAFRFFLIERAVSNQNSSNQISAPIDRQPAGIDPEVPDARQREQVWRSNRR